MLLREICRLSSQTDKKKKNMFGMFWTTTTPTSKDIFAFDIVLKATVWKRLTSWVLVFVHSIVCTNGKRACKISVTCSSRFHIFNCLLSFFLLLLHLCSASSSGLLWLCSILWNIIFFLLLYHYYYKFIFYCCALAIIIMRLVSRHRVSKRISLQFTVHTFVGSLAARNLFFKVHFLFLHFISYSCTVITYIFRQRLRKTQKKHILDLSIKKKWTEREENEIKW